MGAEFLVSNKHYLLVGGIRAAASRTGVLGFRGNHKDARDLQRGIVAAREQLRGPEHADTLTARHKLAWLTGYADDPGRRPRPVCRACPRVRTGAGARSTRISCMPAMSSPAGPGGRAIRPLPGTSTPR
jgi:hypothetical protein